jgi:hypothetical protein
MRRKDDGFEVDREALKRALIGVTDPRTEALILMGALPDDDLQAVISMLRGLLKIRD